MTRVVINTCYGGFSLSEEASRRIAKRKGLPFSIKKGEICDEEFPEGDLFYIGDQNSDWAFDDCRDDPDLLAVVEEMGDLAAGSTEQTKLKIVQFADVYNYRIEMDHTSGIEDLVLTKPRLDRPTE
jgi:hypothetical protein